MNYYCAVLILMLSTISFNTFAQSPYQLEWKKEAAIIGTGSAIAGLSYHLRSRVSILTEAEIMDLKVSDVNSFDAVAIGINSVSAANWSDAIEYSSFALPVLFLTNKKSRKHFGQIALMYGEVYLVTKGLTILAKSTFRRSRPFVYDTDIPLEKKQTISARASLISGHTSTTSSHYFFMAKVFADFYPDSQWKPVVWGTAAAVPALMGYLRVRASRHYPSDVIGGYVVGAAIGVLVPHLHKNKQLKKHGLSLNLGYNSFRLAWRFDNKMKYQ